MILRSLFALVVWVSLATASSQSRNPLQSLAVVEQPSIHTANHRVSAMSHFDLSFHLYNGHERIKLSLEPNHDIIPEGATVTYLKPDGTVARTEPIQRMDHKVFKGIARLEQDGYSIDVGWARITIIRDGIHPLFEGAFSVNHDNHHVQLRSSYMQTKHPLDPEADAGDDDYMVLFRDSDISPDQFHVQQKRNAESELLCYSDDLNFNSLLPDRPAYTDILKRADSHWGAMPIMSLFGKRQIDTQPTSGNGGGVNLASTIGQTSGCPNSRKVALVGIATDCTYTGSFNSTESTRTNVITQVNSASSVWENAFNISLGLQNLTVSDPNCPGSQQAATPWNQNCPSGLTITDRLNLFSGWRGNLGDDNSHWTLLTNCPTGPAVGLAWLGQACVHTAFTTNTTSGRSETISGANVVARTSTEWQVIAHETGHTYGAVHDCTSQTCANANTVNSQQCCPLSAQTCDAGERYIMNPFTSAGITHFSPCTIGNICSAIGRNSVNTTCLSANKGVVTISGQQCGNGIVEQGEDCDCGGEAGCGHNACCDATTCKFKNGAVCDDSNEDCCSSCQFASNGTVCRPSRSDCDPAESCTGTSPICPLDKTAPNGQSCTSGNGTLGYIGNDLECASGQCTSRNLQCQTVMGAYVRGSNDTYACDPNTCLLSCASPAFGPNTCYGLQQNLLDGTPCGGGGMCSNGVCQGSNFGMEIKSWIDGHKGIVIGIASAVGGLLLLSILSCCISRCRRRRRRKDQSKAMRASPGGSWYGAPNGLPPPPAPPLYGNSALQQGQPWQQGGMWTPQQQQQQQQQPWEYEPQGAWRTPPPPPPTFRPPPPPPPPGLYGNGIIGNSRAGWASVPGPPQQQQMAWNGGRGFAGPVYPPALPPSGGMSMRYA